MANKEHVEIKCFCYKCNFSFGDKLLLEFIIPQQINWPNLLNALVHSLLIHNIVHVEQPRWPRVTLANHFYINKLVTCGFCLTNFIYSDFQYNLVYIHAVIFLLCSYFIVLDSVRTFVIFLWLREVSGNYLTAKVKSPLIPTDHSTLLTLYDQLLAHIMQVSYDKHHSSIQQQRG